MKKGILILAGVVMITSTSCTNASGKIKSENVEMAAKRDEKAKDLPVMTFTETNHDFGTINEGDVVEHTFTFTNTGKAPLVIISAKGSCGCTVPKWPKDPIAPGASGEFLVVFNSNGKPNLQNKQVTITANTESGREILKVKAMVAPKVKPTQNGAPISK
ncbi:DUF1573 domain-containing protein [Aquimarina sp. 2201CG5-10]|uniref:DUF1573 domain-containing protein n=1 Tax=Aquimarina callyspongiae TaxID=3098150 RepID=UPI002AB57A6C|nr:DUF1573 domain-containing protein [Aquimarina sp. 2201CG5-10]MDY8136418.1 DUF1573 domain-containing protein [Aquimarina sp. 2201CG5-10]